MLAAPLVRFTLEKRQCQSSREEPCMGRARQTRCMWQQCPGELLLGTSIVSHSGPCRTKKYVTYFEIWVSRRPTARADSSTDAVVDNVRKLCFHGTEQSTP